MDACTPSRQPQDRPFPGPVLGSCPPSFPQRRTPPARGSRSLPWAFGLTLAAALVGHAAEPPEAVSDNSTLAELKRMSVAELTEIQVATVYGAPFAEFERAWKAWLKARSRPAPPFT